MIKLKAHLETYLINKDFLLYNKSSGMDYWRKDISSEEGAMEVIIMDAISAEPDEPEIYKVMVRKVATSGDLKFEANFVLANMLSLQHMEAFINMNMPTNLPFPKD